MAGAGQTTHTFTGNTNNYNHDFNAQIGDYSGKANEQYNRYNAEYNNAQNYENQYNDAFDNRQNYGDLMNQAEGKYMSATVKRHMRIPHAPSPQLNKQCWHYRQRPIAILMWY